MATPHLGWARHLREVRSATEDELGAGRASLAEVLSRRSDAAVGSIHLLCVLEAVPGARKVDTRRRLAELEIDGRRPLSTLSDAEVEVVVSDFGVGTVAP